MSGSNRSLNSPISHGEDDSGEWAMRSPQQAQLQLKYRKNTA